jgi:hypothetical protein
MRYMLIHTADPDLASQWNDEAQASFMPGPNPYDRHPVRHAYAALD